MIVWTLIAGLGRFMGYRGSSRTLFLAAATGAAPVVAVAHLAKAVAKISSWGGFLPGALVDPSGVETFQRLSEGAADMPARLVGLSSVGWVMIILTVLIAWRAWRWAGEMPVEVTAAAQSGMLVSMFLFTSVLTIWALPIW